MTMTIASALRRIKRLKGDMDALAQRAASAVSHLKDAAPAFPFKETRSLLNATRAELIQLRAAVARANATTTVEWSGKPIALAEAIGQLQEIKAEISWLRGLTIREGTTRSSEWDYDDMGRRSRRVEEVTYVTNLTEVARAKELQGLADRFEQLNARVEAANHSTTLSA